MNNALLVFIIITTFPLVIVLLKFIYAMLIVACNLIQNCFRKCGCNCCCCKKKENLYLLYQDYDNDYI